MKIKIEAEYAYTRETIPLNTAQPIERVNLVNQLIDLWFSLTNAQSLAIVGLGVAMQVVCLSLGYYAGWHARELWGPIYDQRGWGALVVLSIVGSSLIIRSRNAVENG